MKRNILTFGTVYALWAFLLFAGVGDALYRMGVRSDTAGFIVVFVFPAIVALILLVFGLSGPLAAIVLGKRPELVACPTCDNQISNRSKICPHCKTRDPFGSGAKRQCQVCGHIALIENTRRYVSNIHQGSSQGRFFDKPCPNCSDPAPGWKRIRNY